MKKLGYTLIAIIVIAIIVLSLTGKDKKVTNEPIRIGASISLTGVASQFGDMSKMAMNMAIDEINASGGINGRQVELYVEDDHTVSKDAVSAWRKLVDVNKVDAVIGGLFDFTAQPLFPLAQNENITFISPINFEIKDKFEMNNNSFVMYPKFEYAITKLNNVIEREGIKKVGMVRYQSDFGAEIERVLSMLISGAGKESLMVETYANIGSSDFRTSIMKLKKNNVDTVFLDMLDFDIVNFLKRASEQNYSPQIIGYTTVRDVIGKSPLIEGAVMIDWEVPSDEFVKKFEARYGTKPERGNNKSYDAVYVIAEAVANSKAKSEVSKYIESHSFKTINGITEFTKDHSVSSTPIKIMQVKDGALIEIN